MKSIRQSLESALLVFRLVVPLAILGFIFTRVEWGHIWDTVKGTRTHFVVMSLLCFPLLIEIGAWRWLVTLRSYGCMRARMRFIRRHYWIGLAVGFFLPASVGWDAYRVAVSTRHFGKVVRNVLVIICEKVLALLTCLLVLGLVLPLLDLGNKTELVAFQQSVWMILAFTAGSVGLLLLLRNNGTVKTMIDRIDALANRLVFKVWMKAGKPGDGVSGTASIRTIALPFYNWKFLVAAVVASTMIQVVTAIRLYFVFLAIGVEVPFLVHLFVGPILFFIFLLPISFGSLGVREGAHVLLYGLFGVSMEAALIVSFIGLLGLLMNTVIGGLVMLFCKWGKDGAGHVVAAATISKSESRPKALHHSMEHYNAQ